MYVYICVNVPVCVCSVSACGMFMCLYVCIHANVCGMGVFVYVCVNVSVYVCSVSVCGVYMFSRVYLCKCVSVCVLCMVYVVKIPCLRET